MFEWNKTLLKDIVYLFKATLLLISAYYILLLYNDIITFQITKLYTNLQQITVSYNIGNVLMLQYTVKENIANK